ncbi:MAG: copper resistance CopC family protein [Candidatus Limnocylindrales bacterium]
MKVAAAIGAMLAIAALPGIVLGHADLETSDPADGATITTPYTLSATFAEEFAPDRSSLTVENASGAVVAQGTAGADSKSMTAELPALPDGAYTVRWTTVTPDDNGIERGTYTFNVGAAVSTPTPTSPPTGDATGSNNDVLIAVGLAAVLIIGVVAFVIVRGRR